MNAGRQYKTVWRASKYNHKTVAKIVKSNCGCEADNCSNQCSTD